MDSSKFLSELDDAFNEYEPRFTTRQVIASLAENDGDMVSINDWSEVVKEHKKYEKPILPPRVQHQYSVVLDTEKRKEVFPKKIGNDKNDNSILDQRFDSIDSKKVNARQLIKSGWILSHGWKNRPNLLKFDSSVIKNNINLFKEKKKTIRERPLRCILGNPSKYHNNSDIEDKLLDKELERRADNGYYYYYNTPEGNLKRSEEIKNAIIDIQLSSHPGARYDVMQHLDKNTVAGRTRPLQTNFTRAKDIKFLKCPRFTDADPGREFLNPLNSCISQTDLPTAKLHAYGRSDYGSIYYDDLVRDGPGPAYNVNKGSLLLSKVSPCANVRLPPHDLLAKTNRGIL